MYVLQQIPEPVQVMTSEYTRTVLPKNASLLNREGRIHVNKVSFGHVVQCVGEVTDAQFNTAQQLRTLNKAFLPRKFASTRRRIRDVESPAKICSEQPVEAKAI